MEMEKIKRDPPEFSSCPNKGHLAVHIISNSINLKGSDDTSDVRKTCMKKQKVYYMFAAKVCLFWSFSKISNTKLHGYMTGFFLKQKGIINIKKLMITAIS